MLLQDHCHEESMSPWQRMLQTQPALEQETTVLTTYDTQ